MTQPQDRAEQRAARKAKWAARGKEQHLVIGVVAIVLGLLFLFDNLNFFEMRHWVPFWPTVFLVIGVVKLNSSGDRSDYVMGCGWLALGTLLMLGHFDILRISWRVIWPLVLIWVGVMLLTRGRYENWFGNDDGNTDGRENHGTGGSGGSGGSGGNGGAPTEPGGTGGNTGGNTDGNTGDGTGTSPAGGISLEKVGAAQSAQSTQSAHTGPTGERASNAGSARPKDDPRDDADAVLRVDAIMGGFERQVSSQRFRGGQITSIMGGCEIDLTHAQIEGEAHLNVFTLMGGITLRVPNDWTIIIRGTPILASIEDRTRVPIDGSRRLVITANAILGGVEVRN